MGARIVAGLVGGGTNAIHRSEDELHKIDDIDLKDAWEDTSPPPVPVPGKKDWTYGRA